MNEIGILFGILVVVIATMMVLSGGE